MKLLTIEDLAARIRFSPHTIRRWTLQRLSGWPQPYRIGPQREWRWREVDVDRWIAKQDQRSQRRDPYVSSG